MIFWCHDQDLFCATWYDICHMKNPGYVCAIWYDICDAKQTQTLEEKYHQT